MSVVTNSPSECLRMHLALLSNDTKSEQRAWLLHGGVTACSHTVCLALNLGLLLMDQASCDAGQFA